MELIIRSAANTYANELFEQIHDNLSEITLNQTDQFFEVDAKIQLLTNSKIEQICQSALKIAPCQRRQIFSQPMR